MPAGLAAAAVAAVPLLSGAPSAAQDALPACAYDTAHPAPVQLGQLPARIVSGRRASPGVVARLTRTGALADRHLTALTQSYERITDGAVTFQGDLLKAYERYPGDDIGYDVQLTSDESPGERTVVRWTDDDPALATHPCTGEARSRDMVVVGADRAKPVAVHVRRDLTDRRRGDASALVVGGKGACALTDPSALTIRARVGGRTKTLKLDMACGAFATAGATVGHVALLAQDGQYRAASQLVVAARRGVRPGTRITLAVREGAKTLATKRFRVAGRPGRLRVVAA